MNVLNLSSHKMNLMRQHFRYRVWIVVRKFTPNLRIADYFFILLLA